MNRYIRVLEELEQKRQRNEAGEYNCIPSPFSRFSDDFVGIEKSTYYLITAMAKGGKTQFASRVFIYEALAHAYVSPDKLKLKIFYYPLEESPEAIFLRYIGYLLYKGSNGKIRVSSKELKSVKRGKPVSKELLELLQSEVYKQQLAFFEEVVFFSEKTNPTGIYKECRDWALSNGEVHKIPINYKTADGVEKVHMKPDHYEPNDPNLYTIIFIDHISLISPEGSTDLRESIIKLSDYLVKLRNWYGLIPVVIQQQASETESTDNFKLGRLRPTIRGLADCKYTARDCNVALGIFSPYRYEKTEYLGYNITRLKDNVRFIEVLVNRDGESNGICPVFFDGSVCEFKELPKPKDQYGNANPELEKAYKFIESQRDKKIQTAMLAFTRRLARPMSMLLTLFKKNE